MPERLTFKTTAELPAHFYYQMEAFVRIVWVDGEDFNIEFGWEEEAAHFVVADGKKLISYASVIAAKLEFNGASYKCGGLGSVMTFPAFRGKGYGGQVVKAATNYIQSENFDFGLLWTAHEKFYKRYGWEVLAGFTTMIGNPEQPEIYNDEIAMLFFASDKAKQNRNAFEQGKLYIGEETW